MDNLTQLWYELKMELSEMSEDSEVFNELVFMMNDMEQRMKGGELYK